KTLRSDLQFDHLFKERVQPVDFMRVPKPPEKDGPERSPDRVVQREPKGRFCFSQDHPGVAL
ncbi:MAG: hypothetical protein KC466_18820, partial [Myxococcales bacterium]|nr:hypothetical protein [Myxococcales bacterium]